ncbi:hypothetical protein PCASD_13305 [Puccinia coronata f. sp. avenae]|uniref:Uncharacterized protein n=1 Tax=Puccinia coronata f. sp. avenae TaxID=200324 RepID=A0A2N5U8X1_9BASI|nr:hypothetical protein PCASD_13305 [Puccinia coronata f. sp. avenae]
MSESAANRATTTPNEPTERTDVVPEAIREERALIDQNFQNLANKFEQYVPGDPTRRPIVPVDTNRETWNEALSRLRFKFLPPLRRQVDTLIQLLHPSELENDINGSRLKLILDIQTELDQSLHEIFFIAAGIKRKPASSPTRADDQDLQQFKEFTRQGLSSALELLNHSLHSIFDQSFRTIRELTKPPNVTTESHQDFQSSRRDVILHHATSATSSMDRVVERITGREFILIQDYWGSQLHCVHSEFLSDLPKIIYRAIHHLEPNDPNQGFAQCLKNEHALPLAQAFIPLIKLSRVFFNKIVKDALNKTPSKQYTNMNSYQLETLGNSVGVIAHYFFKMMKSIADYGLEFRHHHENHNPALIEGIIKKILSCFDSNILLVITYIIPLIPDSVSEPNHLQAYLVEWNKLLSIAAQRCILAAQFYQAASIAADPHQ